MAHEHEPAALDASSGRRPRGRRMAIVTLLMTGAYLWGADFALNGGDRWGLEWEGVRQVNSARAILNLLIPPPSNNQDALRPGIGGLFDFGPRPMSKPVMSIEEQAARERSGREMVAVEGAAHIWERFMWGFCGFLASMAVLSWITPWGRFWHLLVAAAVLLMTILTLAGARYVDIPDRGGMTVWPLPANWYEATLMGRELPTGGGLGGASPRLLPRTYLALAAILSAYGWLLLAVFGFPSRRKPAPPAIETQRPRA